MSGSSLGEDLETEILVRLPAKSLMRFKCVQRSWNLLFKTHAFVTRHRNMHVFDDDHHHLMILHTHIYKNCLTTLLSTHDDPTPKPKLEFDPFFFPNIIYGHCNGVFCLQEHNQNNKILWNPTTREVHVIPPPPSSYPSQNLFGFGADPNTNNFKVVKLNFSVNINTWWYSKLLSVEIYSLSSKSWSLIHRPALPLVRDRCFKDINKYNTLVNGVYHWIMASKLECFPSILCFDFSNNQFSILRPPISNSDGAANLAEINGSLAYVVECEFSLEIWVMDQQGWDKKYRIGPLDGISRIHAIWKKKGKDDGAQVLASSVDRQALTLYNQDGNSVRQLQIDLESSLFRVHEYVPSIAPLSA